MFNIVTFVIINWKGWDEVVLLFKNVNMWYFGDRAQESFNVVLRIHDSVFTLFTIIFVELSNW